MTSEPFRKKEFVSNYLGGGYSSFNAYSSLKRALLIKSDIEKLNGMQIQADIFGHKSYHSIYSYYYVALATCLEWHAKSRIHDLFSFDYKQVKQSDISSAEKNGKFLIAFVEDITFVQYISSSISVSTFESYKSYIDRVLKYANPTSEIKKLFEYKEFEKIEKMVNMLFQERHALVHEIGRSQIYNNNFHGMDSLSEICDITIKIIKSVEMEIYKHSDPIFPNLIGVNFEEVDRENTIKNEIFKLEKQISEYLVENEMSVNFNYEEWDESCFVFWSIYNDEERRKKYEVFAFGGFVPDFDAPFFDHLMQRYKLLKKIIEDLENESYRSYSS